MPVFFIKKIPLFAPLPPEDQERLALLMRRRLIRKGDFLFHKGDEGTALYVIIRGMIKIVVPTKRGEEITLAMLTDGDFFGEMALLDDLPRSADAMALEDTQLYLLNRVDFLSFLSKNDHAVRAIFQALSMRLRRTDDLVAEVCFLNVSARLAKRLVDLVETQNPAGREGDRGLKPYEVKLTQRELASLTGVSRETINKEIRVLRQMGIVTTSRSGIAICDIERLRNRIR